MDLLQIVEKYGEQYKSRRKKAKYFHAFEPDVHKKEIWSLNNYIVRSYSHEIVTAIGYETSTKLDLTVAPFRDLATFNTPNIIGLLYQKWDRDRRLYNCHAQLSFTRNTSHGLLYNGTNQALLDEWQAFYKEQMENRQKISVKFMQDYYALLQRFVAEGSIYKLYLGSCTYEKILTNSKMKLIR